MAQCSTLMKRGGTGAILTIAAAMLLLSAGCKRHPGYPLPEVADKPAEAAPAKATAPTPDKAPSAK